MRFISLFAGVGGFDLGFEKYHDCVLQVEKDQHCLEVLRRRWPNVPKIEDVRDVTKQSAPDVDMVIGGFPCQDVSLAGNRKGLDGGRSGLWFEFHRIISELRPRIAVIENVPGLFSSNGGNDFARILRGLAEQRYMSSWRVLDSQFFGVPQRRRRIFIVSVANPGGGACAEILFERESLRRDTAKSRKSRPGSAGEPPAGPGGGEPVIADPLRSGGDGLPPSPRTPGEVVYIPEVAQPIRLGTEGRGTAANSDGSGNMIAFQQNQRDEVRDLGDVAGALPANPGMKQQNYIQQSVGPLRATDYKGPRQDDPKMVIQDTVGTLAPGAHPEGWNGQDAYTGNLIPQQAVRRLTPVECCRLQGFPDNWNDDQTESQRYRQMGNAVCVPVAEWLGRRIAETIK